MPFLQELIGWLCSISATGPEADGLFARAQRATGNIAAGDVLARIQSIAMQTPKSTSKLVSKL